MVCDFMKNYYSFLYYTLLSSRMKKYIYACLFVIFLIGIFSFWVEASSEIHKSNFTIDVNNFTPWSTELAGSNTTETANNILGEIIQLLIVAFWVLSLFFMTIGAGYMIIYHGQDEFLSRWKSIFVAGLISLAVALTAGLIVQFVAFILYS